MPTLTKEIIEAAIDGLEAKKKRIDLQVAELRAILTGSPVIAPANIPAKATHGGKRKFSAAALKNMRAAQKLRWAKIRGESEPAAKTAPAAKAAPAKKTKRKLSAAGRKAISEAAKKMWASKKAAA